MLVSNNNNYCFLASGRIEIFPPNHYYNVGPLPGTSRLYIATLICNIVIPFTMASPIMIFIFANTLDQLLAGAYCFDHGFSFTETVFLGHHVLVSHRFAEAAQLLYWCMEQRFRFSYLPLITFL